MEKEILIAILSSSLVAAIVTSLIGYIQFKKGNNLEYISLERKRWREDLQDIAADISKDEVTELGQEIDRLKVRINAYGMQERDIYDEDGILWTFFKVMDNGVINSKHLGEYKNILVDSIAVILKHDWENYKDEIKGKENAVFEKLLFIGTICMFAGILYTVSKKSGLHVSYFCVSCRE